MKNFKDSIYIILFLIISACNPCDKLNVADVENNLAIFKKVVEIINRDEHLNNKKSISLNLLKSKVNEKDFDILKSLYLREITKIQDVIIFDFEYNNNSSSFEDKIDNKLDMSTKTTCNSYLFYHNNESFRNRITAFEQFVECRYDYIDIDDSWTIVNISKPCAD
jgi:hypothetical protein